MATEHQHLDLGEQMARLADDLYMRSARHAEAPNVDDLLRRSEVTARLAEMHFVAACARALTAEPPGSPRPSRVRDLPVTKLRDLP